MYVIQMIGIVVCLLMSYITFVYIKQKKINRNQGLLWIIVWLGGVIWLSISEYTKQIVIGVTTVSTVFDLTIGIGVLFAVIICFFNYLKNLKIENNQEKIIRITTIKKAMEEDKNGKTNFVCKSK